MNKTTVINKILYPIFFFICLVLILYLISPSLNIFDQKFFDFHDDTQLTRVHEFVLNLKKGIFPPRMAPEVSHNLGFPLYNFYAPFSYYVSGLIAFVGVPEVYALKITFILTIIISFIGMFYFLRRYFNFLPSILGGILYITSTYFAVEIIIRGNLAECWFLALFPLSLGLIYKNAHTKNRLVFFLTTIVLFFTLISHNLFSLTFIPLSILYIFFQKNRTRNLLSLFIGLLLSSFFWLPVLFETKYTYAVFLAQDTKYQDHFLCLWQLWKSNGWNYGGSIPGCIGDQMSFQLGKTQVILGFLGFITLIWQIFTNRVRRSASPTNTLIISITVLTLFSLFLTTYQSQFIWNIFTPILAMFQFPWRFLVFGMFGLAFLGTYFFHTIKFPFKSILIIFIALSLFFIGRKYFGKPLYDPKTYSDKFASKQYIQNESGYKVREYLIKNADFNYWWSLNPEINPLTKKNALYFDKPIETKIKPSESEGQYQVIENNLFSKKINLKQSGEIKINIHYFPYWSIKLNNKSYIPDKFDQLGRPILKIDKPTNIEVTYKETFVEKFGNILTLFGLLILLIITFLPKSILRKINL